MVDVDKLAESGQQKYEDYGLAVHIPQVVDMLGIYIQGQRGRGWGKVTSYDAWSPFSSV